jgi:hypothetical protein
MRLARWPAWAALTAVATAALGQLSPQDIVAHARLQELMRMCQQQARDELKSTREGDEDTRSPAFREAAMECLRDNRAWHPLTR